MNDKAKIRALEKQIELLEKIIELQEIMSKQNNYPVYIPIPYYPTWPYYPKWTTETQTIKTLPDESITAICDNMTCQ